MKLLPSNAVDNMAYHPSATIVDAGQSWWIDTNFWC